MFGLTPSNRTRTDDNNTLLRMFNDARVWCVGWTQEEWNAVKIKTYINKPRGTFSAIKKHIPLGKRITKILWHVHPLLGNDRGRSNDTAVT
jgi:hypothetical protein